MLIELNIFNAVLQILLTKVIIDFNLIYDTEVREKMATKSKIMACS